MKTCNWTHSPEDSQFCRLDAGLLANLLISCGRLNFPVDALAMDAVTPGKWLALSAMQSHSIVF